VQAHNQSHTLSFPITIVFPHHHQPNLDPHNQSNLDPHNQSKLDPDLDPDPDADLDPDPDADQKMLASMSSPRNQEKM
jgi:hypothetical protein